MSENEPSDLAFGEKYLIAFIATAVLCASAVAGAAQLRRIADAQERAHPVVVK